METRPKGIAERLGWRGIGAALVGVLLLSALFGGGGDDGEASAYEAENQCERFLEDRLKSPSTAEFDLTTTGGPTTFTSAGTVDSQNGFGAMVRSDVTCTVRLDGDTWRLESVTGLG